jgi:stress response protein YsnF
MYMEMTDSNNRVSSQNNSSSEPSPLSPSSMSFTPTTLHTIAVVEEKPSISKESVTSNTVIEKRWVTKTELVRVPITYEEIYVNGKPMSSGGGGILSDLKKAFSAKNDNAKQSNDMEPKGNSVPLSTAEAEKVIPVYGERIIITKKMAKLNELVIRKRRIVENKKIRVNVTRERVKIKHPDGKIEDLST